MDDLKPIIYTIFLVIYILYRIFKKKSQNPTSAPMEPPVEKKPESLFDTIRKGIEKQQEQAKSQKESKQQHPTTQKKIAKASTKKEPSAPAIAKPVLDIVEKEEGVSTTSRRIEKAHLIEDKRKRAFEFKPREAFMMKTLLERHPSVQIIVEPDLA